MSRIGAALLGAACITHFSLRAVDNPAPVLSVDWSGSQTIALGWSNLPPGFVLEAVGSLPPSEPWRGISQAPQWLGNQFVVTQAVNTITSTARFYRLVAKGSPAGFDYLLAHQNADGSWGDPKGTVFRDTAGVVETLALSGQTGTPFYSAGLSALASLAARNNDDASRQAIALALGGWNVSVSAANLLTSQNLEISDLLNTNYPGRGWGLAAGFGNSTLDTALVLRALKAAGQAGGVSVARETLAGSATSAAHPLNLPAGSSNLVLKVRNLTGTVRFNVAYPNGSNYVAVVSTGQTPRSIGGFPIAAGVVTLAAQNLTGSPATYTAELGFTGPDGFDAFRVTTALTYLGLAQNADGGWGIIPGRDSQLMVTAEVVRSLAAWGQTFGPQQVLQSAKTWLLSHQNLDGGFSSVPGSNVSESSLAILAILAVDPTSSLSRAASFLGYAQLPDGSWGSNPWQTALAIQALRMPPVVSPIPGQSVISPYAFTPIALDNFVHDPDNLANQMIWSVGGNALLSVNISSRVAYISYSSSNNPSITEQLTLIATDPNGLSGSATATFIVASNHPPVLGPIPGQSVTRPLPFAPIYLDNYVSDPDETTNQLAWTVTGSTQLVVSVSSNHIVTINYSTNLSTAITEQLSFTVTDPAGLSASTSATFSVSIPLPNQPVVSDIPDQSVTSPDQFAPILLDNFVSDPNTSDSNITWTVIGTNRLVVSFSNRVARVSYPVLTNGAISELLTFIATDPTGLSASNAALFTVTFPSINYVIPRGGHVDDFRLISAPPSVWVEFDMPDYSWVAPPWLIYDPADYPYMVSPTDLRVDYRISISSTAALGPFQFVVTNRILDMFGHPLGPLTNNLFHFRLEVTP